jgi:hypothetical protein
MQSASYEEYQRILENIKKHKINLLIATDYFLKYFWTTGEAGHILRSMKISTKYKHIISFISSMRFITFLIVCIMTILFFKWWALLTVPILVILFGLFLNIAARTRSNILLMVIIPVVGIIFAIIYSEKGLWFQIMLISISFNYFFIKVTQYITHVITTHLLLTNYNFYDFFQSQKDRFDYPFFHVEETNLDV